LFAEKPSNFSRINPQSRPTLRFFIFVKKPSNFTEITGRPFPVPLALASCLRIAAGRCSPPPWCPMSTSFPMVTSAWASASCDRPRLDPRRSRPQKRQRRSTRSSISEHRRAGDGEGKGPSSPLGGGAPRRLLLLPHRPRPARLHQIRARRGNPYSSPFVLFAGLALYPAIHVLALARRTTPPVRASARTPRLHGRRRFVRSVPYLCLV